MKETPRPNCIGFVYHELGITKGPERFISPKAAKISLGKFFTEVDLPEEADALMYTFDHPLEGETIDHMALLRPDGQGAVKQRAYEGAEITESSRVSLREVRPLEIFSQKYLKKNQ